jgi:prepilin-type N-terminal cleavage/methylation domain-containing protein
MPKLLFSRRPRGFTLVEMLVVIGIIAILAALLIPVVQGALANAQKTRNAQELAQLMMAIERYKSENGGQYPPSFGEGGTGNATYYKDQLSSGTHRNTILYRYVIAAYPRIGDADINYLFNDIADKLNQSSGLVFWLSQTSNDPRSPFSNRTNPRKYFEFDSVRLTVLNSVGTAPNQISLAAYRPPYAKESYYAYMESKHYPRYMSADFDTAQGAGNTAVTGAAVNGALRPFLKPGGDKDRNKLANYMNSDSYQLHCAGLDGSYAQSVDKVRYFPSGDQGLTWSNGTIPASEFAADRDNQTNFSEGRCIQDVRPN